MQRRRFASIVVAALFLALPSFAFAFPFGGQIHQIIFCYNNAIYVNLGPPRGGPFIWTPSTRTYRFGPPQRVGQWLLGLAAPPYYCVVSRQPIIVWSGILMTMEGSSGAAAPAYTPGQGASGLGSVDALNGGGFGSSVSGGSSNSSGSVSHVLVSEVYYRPDAVHGSTSDHEWVELYNPTGTSIDLSHWLVRSAQSSQTIPNGTTLASGNYLIMTGTTTVRSLWTIPQQTNLISLPGVFGGGLSIQGDAIVLQNTSGTNIDGVSWGTNTSVFSPSATTALSGHSLIRTTLARDTDTAQDWIDTPAPTPGR